MNFYTIIGNFAVWAVPLAPASFFAVVIYDALAPRLGLWLALFVAIVGAAGFETVGILNGHAMVTFWNRKKYGFAFAAALLLVSYVAIGLYELGATIGGVMIVIGFIVYLTQGLLTEYRSGVAEKKEADESRRQSQLAAQRAQQERERMAVELEHQRELAVIQAKRDIQLAKVAPKLSETFAPPVETFRNFPNDWRKLSAEQKAHLHGLTVQQIVETAGVGERTALNWHNRLAQMEAQQ